MSSYFNFNVDDFPPLGMPQPASQSDLTFDTIQRVRSDANTQSFAGVVATSTDTVSPTSDTAVLGAFTDAPMNQGLEDVEVLYGTVCVKPENVLAPAIFQLRQAEYGPDSQTPELLQHIENTEPDDHRIKSYVLSVKRLADAEYKGVYRIIAKSQVYIDPWKVFRLLDVPHSIRLRIFGFWLSVIPEGASVALREFSVHRHAKLKIDPPPWAPILGQINRVLHQECFPLFLVRVTIVAHSVYDLEHLHEVLSTFKGLDDSSDSGYRYIRSLKLPHFFATPGPVNKRRKLELELLDQCTNVRTLYLGFSTSSFTRPLFRDERAFALRELMSLEDILDTYSLPLVFDCCHQLEHLYLACLDDDSAFRHTMDEPLRPFVTIANWFTEGFNLRLRNTAVHFRVEGGRFHLTGDSVPDHITLLDNSPLQSSIPILELAIQRHWLYADTGWIGRSRAKILNPWEEATARGIDRVDVQELGDIYRL